MDPEAGALPRKPEIDLEGFLAIDLRVGRVVAVEPFPEARRPAWRMHVDFGPEIGELRTSAQVTNYSATELLGRNVIGAINLGDRRIAGWVSQFLVLGAVEANGTVRLLRPDGDPPAGSPVA